MTIYATKCFLFWRALLATAGCEAQKTKVLSKQKSAQYVLEGDIRSCFDKISHQFILDNIPTDKQVLKQWLKSGVVDRRSWYPTEEGTPQGSIVSPTIANMVLDGMQETIDKVI